MKSGEIGAVSGETASFDSPANETAGNLEIPAI
jgi:hypothetical protein